MFVADFVHVFPLCLLNQCCKPDNTRLPWAFPSPAAWYLHAISPFISSPPSPPPSPRAWWWTMKNLTLFWILSSVSFCIIICVWYFRILLWSSYQTFHKDNCLIFALKMNFVVIFACLSSFAQFLNLVVIIGIVYEKHAGARRVYYVHCGRQ